MANYRSTFKSLLHDPLEISLVFDVFECKKCKNLWPLQNDTCAFGVVPSFDFFENYPNLRHHNPDMNMQIDPIVNICEAHFPKPSVLSGCRKAPILFVDVNPRMSAQHDRIHSACQMFPFFTNQDDTCDLFKYAYYYRYRRLGCDYFNLQSGQDIIQENCIYTEQTGIVNSIKAEPMSHRIIVELKYIDGSTHTLNLSWVPHESCYHVFITESEEFCAGTLIAAQLYYNMNEKIPLQTLEKLKYIHLNHILSDMNAFLHQHSYEHAHLQLGEDLSFLHLAACASPEWAADAFNDSSNSIMQNCVNENAWALKQIVQSKPAVILLNGDAAFRLFCSAFGEFIHPFIPAFPADRSFRLYQQTCNIHKPYYFEFSGMVEDEYYQFNSRIVVLPDIYDENVMLPQIRISERNWDRLEQNSPLIISYLGNSQEVQVVPPEQEYDFNKIFFLNSTAQVLSEIRRVDKHAHQFLLDYFYQPDRMIAAVLQQEFMMGNLSCSESTAQHLDRTDGDCAYCQNRYWAFPQGCPYGKVINE